jgi:hypothetical protein
MATFSLQDGTNTRVFSSTGASRLPRVNNQIAKSTKRRDPKSGRMISVPGKVTTKVLGTDVKLSAYETASGEYVPNGASFELRHFIPSNPRNVAKSDLALLLPVYTAATTTTKEIRETVKVDINIEHPLQGRAVVYTDIVKALYLAIDYYTSGTPVLDTAADGRVNDMYFKRDPD